MLTHDRLLQILSYDQETGQFTWLVSCGRVKKGRIAGSVRRSTKRGTNRVCRYWSIQIDGERYLAHRLALFYVRGEWPSELVDHENRNGIDNRWGNLREATFPQNASNRKIHSNNSSGFKGVNAENGKWRARICAEGRRIQLGIFETRDEAFAAYAAAAPKLHGEFARLS